MSRCKQFLRPAIFLATLLFLAGQALDAQVSPNCTVSRSDVEQDLANGLSDADIEAKYRGCAPVDSANPAAASIRTVQDGVLVFGDEANVISNTGSTYYEAIESCGYHPQREEGVCAIEIRRNFGFGGQICQSRGSTEYVLFCVDYADGAGLVPVHTGTVHVHDAIPGSSPPWDFGVVIQANPRLASLPNNGRTLRGRFILSWAIAPTGCNYRPWWGNQADIRLRLDP